METGAQDGEPAGKRWGRESGKDLWAWMITQKWSKLPVMVLKASRQTYGCVHGKGNRPHQGL